MGIINDINQAAQYRGDVGLGGGPGTPISIDWRPLQQLAQYTFLYNKSQYDQRQKDADEKIDELAKLTAYDAATGEGKDKDEVLDRLTKLKEKGAKFAGTVWDNPNDKTKAYFQFQKEIADDIKVINSATARQTKLQIYNDKVDKNVKLSAAEKTARKKQAQRIFDNTDIMTQFSIPDYDNTVPKTSAPIYENNNVIVETPNGMIDADIKQFSFTANDKASYLEGNDLTLTPPSANATQQEKDAFEQKKLAFGKTGTGAWMNAAQFWNAAIDDPNYKKTVTTSDINVMGEPAVTKLTGEIDIGKIKSENPLAGDVFTLAERYNKYANDRIEAIKKGYFIDNVTGLKIQFKNTDRVEDIPIIDLTKPVSPKNLALLHRFESAEPDKIDKKYTSTDNQIQREQLAEQKRNNNLDFQVAWENAKNKGTGSGGGKGSEGIETPAILFGKHIERVKNYIQNNKAKEFTVNYAGTDKETRLALGLTEGQKVTYRADGTYQITGEDNKAVKVGTLEELKQGFINAVKIGIGEDGAQTQGFQEQAENSFNNIFGTTSGTVIFNGWGNSNNAQPSTTTTVVETQTRTGKDGKVYTSTDGITWTAPDGTTVKLKNK